MRVRLCLGSICPCTRRVSGCVRQRVFRRGLGTNRGLLSVAGLDGRLGIDGRAVRLSCGVLEGGRLVMGGKGSFFIAGSGYYVVAGVGRRASLRVVGYLRRLTRVKCSERRAGSLVLEGLRALGFPRWIQLNVT